MFAEASVVNEYSLKDLESMTRINKTSTSPLQGEDRGSRTEAGEADPIEQVAKALPLVRCHP